MKTRVKRCLKTRIGWKFIDVYMKWKKNGTWIVIYKANVYDCRGYWMWFKCVLRCDRSIVCECHLANIYNAEGTRCFSIALVARQTTFGPLCTSLALGYTILYDVWYIRPILLAFVNNKMFQCIQREYSGTGCIDYISPLLCRLAFIFRNDSASKWQRKESESWCCVVFFLTFAISLVSQRI